MKTVNYVLAGVFTLLAIGSGMSIFYGYHHQIWIFLIAVIMAFVFFSEAKNNGK